MPYKSLHDHEVLALEFWLMPLERPVSPDNAAPAGSRGPAARTGRTGRTGSAGHRGAYHNTRAVSHTSVLLPDAAPREPGGRNQRFLPEEPRTVRANDLRPATAGLRSYGGQPRLAQPSPDRRISGRPGPAARTAPRTGRRAGVARRALRWPRSGPGPGR